MLLKIAVLHCCNFCIQVSHSFGFYWKWMSFDDLHKVVETDDRPVNFL